TLIAPTEITWYQIHSYMPLVVFIVVRITFLRAELLIGIWFVIPLVDLGTVSDVQTDWITYFSHVGGSVFGCVTGRPLEDRKTNRKFVSVKQQDCDKTFASVEEKHCQDRAIPS